MTSNDGKLSGGPDEDEHRRGGVNRYVTLCLVIAGSMYLGALLVFFIGSRFDWTYTPYDHTTGKIALLDYPNHKEFFLFLVAAVIVPCCIMVGVWLQHLAGRAAQKYFRIDSRVTWWLTGVALALPCVFHLLDNSEALLIVLPVAGGLLLLSPLVLYVFRFLAQTSTGRVTSIASVCLALLIGAACFMLNYYMTSQASIDSFHEGAERLAPARAFLEGAVPYRDYFVVHGLGQDTLITAAAFKLFGMNLHSDRLFRAMLAGTAIFLVIVLLRVLFGPGLLAPIVGGLHIFAANPRLLTFNLFVCVLALTFKSSGRRKWCFISGMLAAVCFLWSWDIGAVALPAGGLVLLLYGVFSKKLRRRVLRILLFYVLGILPVALPFGIFIYSSGAGGEFVHQHLETLRFKDHWDALPLPEPAKMWEASNAAEVIFPYLVIVIVLFAVFAVVDSGRNRKRGAEWWTSLFLIIFCMPFMKRAFGRSDFAHTAFGAAPAFLAILLLLGKAVSSAKVSARHGIYAAVALVCAFIVPVSHVLIYKSWSRPTPYFGQALQERGNPLIERMVLERIGSVKMSAYDFREMSQVCEFLTKDSALGNSFFDFSNGGLFYYLLPGRNATPYFSSFYLATWGAQRRAIHALEQRQPRYVIFTSDPGIKEWAGVHIEIRHALLCEYIYRNYTPVKVIGRYIIAERGAREDSPETSRPVVGVLSKVYDYARVPEMWGRYYLEETLEGAQVLHTARDARPRSPDADGFAETWDVSLPETTWEAGYLLIYARIRGAGRVEVSWHDTLNLKKFTTTLYFIPSVSDNPKPYLIRTGSLAAWRFRAGECKLEMTFFGKGALNVEKILLIKKSEY